MSFVFTGNVANDDVVLAVHKYIAQRNRQKANRQICIERLKTKSHCFFCHQSIKKKDDSKPFVLNDNLFYIQKKERQNMSTLAIKHISRISSFSLSMLGLNFNMHLLSMMMKTKKKKAYNDLFFPSFFFFLKIYIKAIGLFCIYALRKR